jgi:hypothetical protein
MANKDWTPCPRCTSQRVITIGPGAIAGGLFGSSGCLILVGFVFPPLWLMVPILWLMAFFGLFGKRRLFCQDCHLNWNPKRPPSFPVR